MFHSVHPSQLQDLAAIRGHKMLLPGEREPEWLLRQWETARCLAEHREAARAARVAGRRGLLRAFLRLGFNRD